MRVLRMMRCVGPMLPEAGEFLVELGQRPLPVRFDGMRVPLAVEDLWEVDDGLLVRRRTVARPSWMLKVGWRPGGEGERVDAEGGELVLRCLRVERPARPEVRREKGSGLAAESELGVLIRAAP